MRRRRAEMAQTSGSVNSSANLPATGRAGSNLLKEIDDALEQVNTGSNADAQDSEWVHEGDITSTVLPLTPSASGQVRSEEHTSELQSLMRISYAVFCLNKQTKYTLQYSTTMKCNTH